MIRFLRFIDLEVKVCEYRVSFIMVEHCSANAEAMGSNPIEVSQIFFRLICNCLNCNYHGDDHIFI